MNRYRLTLIPEAHYGLRVGSRWSLSEDALESLIEGAIVHELTSSGAGYPVYADLQLDDPEPSLELVNSILVALEQMGYSVAEGEISTWVAAETQGVIGGALSGAGIGAMTKNEYVMTLLALVGAIAGHSAGAKIQKHAVIYRLARAYPGAPLELIPIPDARAPKATLADWLAQAQKLAVAE